MCWSIERPCAFQLSSGARDNNNNTRIQGREEEKKKKKKKGKEEKIRDVLESQKYLV
jgi:hypothetical protein